MTVLILESIVIKPLMLSWYCANWIFEYISAKWKKKWQYFKFSSWKKTNNTINHSTTEFTDILKQHKNSWSVDVVIFKTVSAD